MVQKSGSPQNLLNLIINVGLMMGKGHYIDRPFYHVVEEFCGKIETCGRQVLFEVGRGSKVKVTDEILATFQNVIN